jgi:Exostosin family
MAARIDRQVASAYLLSAAPSGPGRDPKAFLDLEQMRASARANRFGAHRLAEDPGEADLILFVETSSAAGHYFERVRSHPVYREFMSKSYLFSSTDRVVPFLPGVYASIERRWYWPSWTRSGHYLGVKEEGGLRYLPSHSPSRLFSFVGDANTHPVRQRLMGFRHPDAVMIDTHAEALAIKRGERPPVSQEGFVGRYVRAIEDCAFVLCPPGGGTSSFRLFETMMLGRVPVIVSDPWVPPLGPDWDSFSVRVKESDVDGIPRLLETRAADARTMGDAARAAWLDWFSESASFHRTVEWCLDLARHAPARAGLRRYAPYVQMLRPYHAARWGAKRLGHGQASGRGAQLGPDTGS